MKFYRVLLVIFFVICIELLSAGWQPLLSQSSDDSFELEYSQKGGKTGQDETLKIFNNGNVYYQKPVTTDFRGNKVIYFTNSTITQEEKKKLKSVLERNRFYSMEDSYESKAYIYDGTTYCIRVTKPVIKNVCAGYGGDAPRKLFDIVKELNQLIESLPKNYLAIRAKYKLTKWPYPNKIRLSDLTNKSQLDEELFNYFIQEIKRKDSLPFEDGVIYEPSITCQGTPFKEFSKNDDCRFSLGQVNILEWPTNFNIKLSDISGERVLIENKNYQAIKNFLEGIQYGLILENEISENSYVYMLELSYNEKIEKAEHNR